MADRCTSRSVAEGLARWGTMCTCSSRPAMAASFPAGPAHVVGAAAAARQPAAAAASGGAVARRARAIRPDVVIERYYNFGGEGILAARQVGALAVLEVNAPVVDHPGSAKQWLDRLAHRRAAAPVARLAVPAGRSDRDAERTESFPRTCPRRACCRPNGAPIPTRFRPGATGPVPFTRNDGDTVVVFAGAFARGTARSPGRGDARVCARGPARHQGRAHRRRVPSCLACAAQPHGVRRHHASQVRCRMRRCPGDPRRRRYRRRAVRRRGASVACARVSLVAAEDLRVHGVGLPVVAPRIERLAHIVRRRAERAAL